MNGNTMRPETHVSDREMVLAADGELSDRRLSEVRAHLVSCQVCRTRMNEMDEAIADLAGLQQHELPSAQGPRALLRAQLSALETEASRSHWPGLLEWASLAVVLLTISGLLLAPRALPRRNSRVVPDPTLTPGAVVLIGERDVCAAESPGKPRLIPAALAQKVFEEYGIRSPQPRAYELDYLIAPELGGSDDIRNFWPQPYSTTVWNAHLKDALEDRLHDLVCTGQVSLAVAQHDIAANWVSAYKQYFKTETPLPDHYAFAKDRPWEQ
jgi:hypothetical protein